MTDKYKNDVSLKTSCLGNSWWLQRNPLLRKFSETFPNVPKWSAYDWAVSGNQEIKAFPESLLLCLIVCLKISAQGIKTASITRSRSTGSITRWVTERHGCELPGLDVSLTWRAVGRSSHTPGHSRYIRTFDSFRIPREFIDAANSRVIVVFLCLNMLTVTWSFKAL